MDWKFFYLKMLVSNVALHCMKIGSAQINSVNSVLVAIAKNFLFDIIMDNNCLFKAVLKMYHSICKHTGSRST